MQHDPTGHVIDIGINLHPWRGLRESSLLRRSDIQFSQGNLRPGRFILLCGLVFGVSCTIPGLLVLRHCLSSVWHQSWIKPLFSLAKGSLLFLFFILHVSFLPLIVVSVPEEMLGNVITSNPLSSLSFWVHWGHRTFCEAAFFTFNPLMIKWSKICLRPELCFLKAFIWLHSPHRLIYKCCVYSQSHSFP